MHGSVTFKTSKAQPFHSRYSNHFQVTVTPTEMQLIFGELDVTIAQQTGSGMMNTPGTQAVELHSRITLPHALAKELRDKLTQMLDQIEKEPELLQGGRVR